MTKVLIADDQPVRAGLKQYLQESGRLAASARLPAVCRCSTCFGAATSICSSSTINMPDRGGLDLLKPVRAGYPNVKC